MSEAGTSRDTGSLAITEGPRSFPPPICFCYPFHKSSLCRCHHLLLHCECQSRELSRERLPHSGFTVPSHTARPRMLRCSSQRQAFAWPKGQVIFFCVA